MSQLFVIHPENPQTRLVKQTVEILRTGGVIAYPTDSGYALGCCVGDKSAVDTIRRIRRLDDKHHFTLVCRDLSEISMYARMENTAYRLIKSHTPGPYTFILKASKEVPRRLLHPKRRTLGIRIPANPIALALLDELREPLMSVTLILPGEELPMTDPYEIRDTLQHELALVIDGGFCGFEPTSVVDLADETPVIVRQGQGDVSAFVED